MTVRVVLLLFGAALGALLRAVADHYFADRDPQEDR